MAEERRGSWFGFGFCGFGQALGSGHGRQVHSPEPLRTPGEGADVCRVSASWSYTAFVTREGRLELSGSAGGAAGGCRDAWASALCRHGQLGHGTLEAELEPRLLEALQGLPMAEVAAGGWHSVCVSETGDIYIWGWNESGQLALPSRSLAEDGKTTAQEARGLKEDGSDARTGRGEAGGPAPFIAIQPFPALLDLPPGTDAAKASCGSRHTAVVTRTGELYTWGWGKYGQLGHKDTSSLDRPRRVEYFVGEQLRVRAVSCGPWNTYVYAVEHEQR
ncbi:RCC1 domain-containing protein 1 [Suricata suricatta]|uniref:RCC1 domain-containing protein 1 n=1 Tax=Suricata suricatta TaxID=37032 RepID=UPI001155EB35|nr:RCC1 domain-containing protein 1 [Suricata suricatta]